MIRLGMHPTNRHGCCSSLSNRALTSLTTNVPAAQAASCSAHGHRSNCCAATVLQCRGSLQTRSRSTTPQQPRTCRYLPFWSCKWSRYRLLRSTGLPRSPTVRRNQPCPTLLQQPLSPCRCPPLAHRPQGPFPTECCHCHAVRGASPRHLFGRHSRCRVPLSRHRYVCTHHSSGNDRQRCCQRRRAVYHCANADRCKLLVDVGRRQDLLHTTRNIHKYSDTWHLSAPDTVSMTASG